MELYIKPIRIYGKWWKLSKLCAPLRGHSLRGLFFAKSLSLFIKSAFFCVFMIKPPFYNKKARPRGLRSAATRGSMDCSNLHLRIP